MAGEMPKQGHDIAKLAAEIRKKAYVMGKQGALNPQTHGAIIGAAIGALGGMAGGGAGGASIGRQDAPLSPISGEAKGGARGALVGAVGGAAGGALVGHTLMGKQPQKNLKKLIGGSALLLGTPILGGAAAVPGLGKKAEDAQLSKCSGCGKMSKVSELGKCSACGKKH